MAAVADRIINRVRGKGRGWAFTPTDFLNPGARVGRHGAQLIGRAGPRPADRKRPLR